MDLLPQNMNEWMRSVRRDIQELRRHRHPSSDAQVADLRNRVSGLEDRVSALGARVDVLEDDTGWVQLGPDMIDLWENGTMYRRIGENVTIRSRLRWTGSGTEIGGRIDIGTLPSSDAPSVRVWATIYHTADDPRSLEVDTDGTVFVIASGGGSVQDDSLLATTMSYPRG